MIRKICRNRLRLYVLALLMLLCGGSILSAKNFRDIFLIDVSASMSGQGDRASASVFEHMRTELSDAFASAKSAEVSLVTFGTNVFDTKTFKIPSDRAGLTEFLQAMEPRMGRTDIYQAWKAGLELLPDTVSRLFLISDGQHNSKVYTFDKLKEQLLSYHQDHPQTEAFLVLLDPSYDAEQIVPLFENQEGMHIIRTLRGIYDEPEVKPAPEVKPQPAPVPPAPEGRPLWLWCLIAGLGLAAILFLILFALCLRRQRENN